jgi:hypothetical protein
MKSQSSNSVLILLESPFDLLELKKIILEKKHKIITFDYDSHKILTKEKIDHEISDNFLIENDLKTISKNSKIYASWAKNLTVAEILNYEGVNLGHLYNIEFHYFLVPFLKKFVEVTRIFNKYNSGEFFATSTLFNIISALTNSVTKIGNQNDEYFLYDTINFSFNIVKKKFEFNISRKYYKILKSTSEFLLSIIVNRGIKIENSQRNVLLVELDTIRYRNLISSFKNSSLHSVLFARRRPVVWNGKSFSIVRNTKSFVITKYVLNHKKLKVKQQEKSEIKKKLDILWSKESFFESFFKINDHSFWQIIKPYFKTLTEKRVMEAIEEIKIVKTILDKYSIESIVLLSDTGFNEQIVIQLAQKINIPIMLLQHGLAIDYEDEERIEHNEFAGGFSKLATKYIAAGEMVKRYAIKCGMPSNKIEILGSPIFDEHINEKSKNNNSANGYVLLVTSSPQNNIVYDLMIGKQERYEYLIKTICKIINKFNKNLIVKLHPWQGETDITNIVKEINPKITVLKHANTIQLIKNCSVFIVVDISTTILEAQILEKPVISVSYGNNEEGLPEIFTSKACIRTNIEDFESVFNNIITDHNYRQELIKNEQNFVSKYLVNPGKSADNIIKYLENLLETK